MLATSVGVIHAVWTCVSTVCGGVPIGFDFNKITDGNDGALDGDSGTAATSTTTRYRHRDHEDSGTENSDDCADDDAATVKGVGWHHFTLCDQPVEKPRRCESKHGVWFDRSTEENDFVTELMRGTCCTPESAWAAVWLGFSDRAAEGVWVWEDGHRGRNWPQADPTARRPRLRLPDTEPATRNGLWVTPAARRGRKRVFLSPAGKSRDTQTTPPLDRRSLRLPAGR